MGTPLLLLLFGIEHVNDFLPRIIVEDCYLHQLQESLIFEFPPEREHCHIVRDALVVFLVVGLPEVFVFRIPPQEHLQPFHSVMEALALYAGEGVIDEALVQSLTYHPHYCVVQDSPREVVLLGNVPVLTGIIEQFHIRVFRLREVQLQDHPLKLLQIGVCVEIVPADVPILAGLS